jgi:hypothetical protein
MRRLLPLLLLLLLLLLSSCGEAAPGSDGSGLGTIAGTVLLGPMCPVETEASPCPDEPLPGVTVQAVLQENMVVATTESDEQGHFSFDLAPGTYAVQAVPEDDPARTSRPVDVTVATDETVEIDVQVDSGIR